MKNGKPTGKSPGTLSGKFLLDHLRRALPDRSHDEIAVDSIGATASTLSRWVRGKQCVSAQKGHRNAITRVLDDGNVIQADAAREFWNAYDYLWSVDGGDAGVTEPPEMARPYLGGSFAGIARGSVAPAVAEMPLSLPGRSERGHHFSARALPLSGRAEELANLHRFLDEPRRISWMQVAGSGGQGKSRLALELATAADELGWHAGFIGPDAFRRFVQDHQAWQPRRDTLIVVDYVIGFEQEVGDALRAISTRPGPAKRIRVLIVERQRWDRGFNVAGGDADGLVGGRTAAAGVADWYVRLSRSLYVGGAGIDALRREPSIIELTSLAEGELVGIVRLWAERRDAPVVAGHDEIALLLRRIDPSGRPLYAYFLAEALIGGFQVEGWTRDDLLEHTLTRDQVHRWARRFGGAPPSLGDDHQALRLAALATLVGELDLNALRGVAGWTYPPARVREQATVLLDGPVGVSVKGPGDTLSKLEPDILGGWFLLESARQWSNAIEPIVQAAWALAPRATAATLLRLGQDFPTHPALGAVLATPPPSNAAEDAYKQIASGLLIALRGEIRRHRIQILPRMEAAALEGDRDAMARLGLCHQDAIGIDEPDLPAAHRWFLRAANLGDGRSMAYLGHWYFVGRDGPPDHRKAFDWFVKGAEAGDGHAMAYLGMCHANGIGTPMDATLAVRLFRRGSEAGDGLSAVYLGTAFLEGSGVARSDEEAFRCFQQGADLGSGHAHAYLGQMHLEGRSTPVDASRAVRCFKDGIAAGSAAALACLGHCLVEGLGIGRDVVEGLGLIRRAIQGRSGYAMFLLGDCHHRGLGVERDEAKALELWREAARLGEVKAERKLTIVQDGRSA